MRRFKLARCSAAIEKLDYLVDLGIDFVEPVNFFARTRLGIGDAWYSVHEPTAAPTVWSGHRRMPCRSFGRVDRRGVLNHLGPSGNFCGRPVPVVGQQRPWGDGISLPSPNADSDEGSPLYHRLRAAMDARLPRRRLCGWTPMHAHGPGTTAVHVLEELCQRDHGCQASWALICR